MDCYNCGELKLLLVGHEEFYCEQCVHRCLSKKYIQIISYNSELNIWTKSKMLSIDLVFKFLFIVEFTTFINRLRYNIGTNFQNIIKMFGSPELCIQNIDYITPNVIEECRDIIKTIKGAIALVKL